MVGGSACVSITLYPVAVHSDDDDLLRRRAYAAGIQTSFLDDHGRHTEVSAEALRATIDALGDPVDHPLSVVVAWDGVLPDLPEGARLVLESGDEQPATGVVPLGYHGLHLADGLFGTVVSAPRHAPAATRRQWGVFLPLHALRTRRSPGVADLTDLSAMFQWLATLGGEVLLTLPLLAQFLDDPADWSPYSPVSRRMWNELYVDVRTGVNTTSVPVPPAPVDRLLDYPALWDWQYDRLAELPTELGNHPDLLRFLIEQPNVAEYARFRAAQQRHGRNWRVWPAHLPGGDPEVERVHILGQWLADRQLATVARRAKTNGQILSLDLALGTHSDGFDVWQGGDLFAQEVSVGAPPDGFFLAGQNWGFPPVQPGHSRLTGHRYIAETIRHHVRHAGLLRIDHIMGLARLWWVARGASAGNGAYVSYPLDELIAVACLEAHRVGAVIVGENLGTVPAEVDRALGEHHLLGMHVAQERLGDFAHYRPHRSAAETQTMLTTHDTVPFASWWAGGDIVRKVALGLITEEQAADEQDHRREDRRRIVERLHHEGQLARSDDESAVVAVLLALWTELSGQDALIGLVTLEDTWLETEAQNVPGTFQQLPNWRRVAARSLEEFAADPFVSQVLQVVAAGRAAPTTG